MEILVNFDYRKDDIATLLDIERLALLVLSSENLPRTAEVSISFIDDELMHRLNAEYRGIDRPTDVLSFECDGYDDDFRSDPLQTDAPFELGDIFVAVDVAQRQAPEYGMLLEEEISLLVVHGLLHLCGYDHMEEDEAQVMEAREEELLSLFWGRPFPRHGCVG